MLSEAKHLQYLLEDKPKQILRSAQDDSPVGFIRSLPERAHLLPRSVIVARAELVAVAFERQFDEAVKEL